MGYADKVRRAESEVQRFLAKKRGSEFSRPADATNLVNALERLRLLRAEAKKRLHTL